MEITAGFGRKLRPGHATYEFETVEASVFVKVTEADGAVSLDEQAVADLVQRLQNAATIAVCERLGLAYEADGNGVVRESVPSAGGVVLAFPGAVAQPAPVAAVAAPAPPPPSPLAPVPAASLVQPPNIPLTGDAERDQLIADINANPQNWIDVRAQKKNPKGPDFRHRTIPDAKNPQYKLSAWITAR